MSKPIMEINTEYKRYNIQEDYLVKSITPYLENGEMAHITHYRVILDDGTEIRVNGKYVVEVVYYKE
jgi:hypothetical protein